MQEPWCPVGRLPPPPEESPCLAGPCEPSAGEGGVRQEMAGLVGRWDGCGVKQSADSL